jgi:hypothetical protein
MRKIAVVLVVLVAGLTLSVSTASALEVSTGQGNKTVIDPVGDTGANPAHGPGCAIAVCEGSGTNPGGPNGEGTSPGGFEHPNLGAWNAYFNTTGTNSAICGIASADTGGHEDIDPCPS